MRRWMLHGNVSRKGYGNALLVGMVAVLRKYIMRLMMTERIMPRVWMHRQSMRQLPREWQWTLPKRLEKYGGGSVNNRILTLVQRTHALIIGNSQSNQEVHKEISTPRRSVWGFGYPCASSTHGT